MCDLIVMYGETLDVCHVWVHKPIVPASQASHFLTAIASNEINAVLGEENSLTDAAENGKKPIGKWVTVDTANVHQLTYDCHMM